MAYTDNLIDVETYRGFTIRLNKNEGLFSAWGEFSDKEFSSPNLKYVRQDIDKYLKRNAAFEPFKAVELYGYDKGVIKFGEIIEIIGLRKDGKFTTLEKNGKKSTVSSYSEKEFAVWQQDFQKHAAELEIIEEEKREFMDGYTNRKCEVFKKIEALKPVKITTFKHQILNRNSFLS